jgi:hypothetical protein
VLRLNTLYIFFYPILVILSLFAYNLEISLHCSKNEMESAKHNSEKIEGKGLKK